MPPGFPAATAPFRRSCRRHSRAACRTGLAGHSPGRPALHRPPSPSLSARPSSRSPVAPRRSAQTAASSRNRPPRWDIAAARLWYTCRRPRWPARPGWSCAAARRPAGRRAGLHEVRVCKIFIEQDRFRRFGHIRQVGHERHAPAAGEHGHERDVVQERIEQPLARLSAPPSRKSCTASAAMPSGFHVWSLPRSARARNPHSEIRSR